MNDVSDFRSTFLAKIGLASSNSGTSLNEEFIEAISEMLCNSEEIPSDINYAYYEGLIANGKKRILLSGYVFNDYDNCMNLYVIPPIDLSSDLGTISSDDIDRYFSACSTFISEASYITDTAEESHPAYDLAHDIANNQITDLERYHIFIVTDKSTSKNYKPKNQETIRNTSVHYSIIDIDRLFQLENSRTGKVALKIDLREYTQGIGIPCMLANKTDYYQSYLCNRPGLILARLYNSFGSSLLEGNVRSFLQQKNKVNKGIRDTILKEPENFFIYNNGITATADEVQYVVDSNASYITHIEGLQIVNGGQTTASLAACLLNDKKFDALEKIENIFVPMKLTVVPFEKAVELIPSIARFANSQNKVSETDLWSNHPFHIKMENISRNLPTPLTSNRSYGTYWFYERARGQYKQSTYRKSESEKKQFEKECPKNQLITKTDFAKYFSIMKQQPYKTCLGGEKVFAKVAGDVSSEWEKNKNLFNESYFKEFVSTAIIYKTVDSIIKKQGREYKAQICAYAISLLFYQITIQYPNSYLNYKEIWNSQSIKPLLSDHLLSCIDIAYDELTSPGRTVENITEWAKRNECWTQMKKISFTFMPDFKSLLISESEYFESKGIIKSSSTREITEAQAAMEVYRFGAPNWQRLLQWDSDKQFLNKQEKTIAEIAADTKSFKFPKDKQCLILIKALDNARLNGFE